MGCGTGWSAMVAASPTGFDALLTPASTGKSSLILVQRMRLVA